ncbi:MAG: condensation domain-containing protein, partial [Bacteroidota bacterium]
QVMDLENPHYNVGGYVLLEGEMDKASMIAAIRHTQKIYDIHRMSFDFEGDEPRYTLLDKHIEAPISEYDFSTAEHPFNAAEAWMSAQYNIAISLEQEKLYEFAILYLGPQRHILFCKYHHILTDAYGFTVVLKEVSRKYSELVKQAAPEKLAYKQYAVEIEQANEYVGSAKYEKDRSYWLDKFANMPSPVLQQQYQTEHKNKSNTLVFKISDRRRKHYETLNQQLGTSLQHLTLVALHLYYGKLMPEQSTAFGVTAYKRRKHQWNTLGMFAGVMPYKADYNPNLNLKELVKKINSQLLKDYRHQNYPVSHLNRELKMLKNSNAQLFEIVVNYLLLDFDNDFVGLTSTTCDLLSDYEKVPLRIWWRDYGPQQALELRVDHNLTYINAADAQLVVERVLQILDRLTDQWDTPLGEINILNPKEEERLLTTFNATNTVYPQDQTLVAWFEEQVRQQPQAPALVYEGKTWTYQKLNEQANQLAHYLKQRGLQKEELVVISMEHSPYVIVGLLATMKAGGAYVPVDPTYPAQRLQYILDDTEAIFVITQQKFAKQFNIQTI